MSKSDENRATPDTDSGNETRRDDGSGDGSGDDIILECFICYESKNNTQFTICTYGNSICCECVGNNMLVTLANYDANKREMVRHGDDYRISCPYHANDETDGWLWSEIKEHLTPDQLIKASEVYRQFALVRLEHETETDTEIPIEEDSTLYLTVDAAIEEIRSIALVTCPLCSDQRILYGCEDAHCQVIGCGAHFCAVCNIIEGRDVPNGTDLHGHVIDLHGGLYRLKPKQQADVYNVLARMLPEDRNVAVDQLPWLTELGLNLERLRLSPGELLERSRRYGKKIHKLARINTRLREDRDTYRRRVTRLQQRLQLCQRSRSRNYLGIIRGLGNRERGNGARIYEIQGPEARREAIQAYYTRLGQEMQQVEAAQARERRREEAGEEFMRALRARGPGLMAFPYAVNTRIPLPIGLPYPFAFLSVRIIELILAMIEGGVAAETVIAESLGQGGGLNNFIDNTPIIFEGMARAALQYQLGEYWDFCGMCRRYGVCIGVDIHRCRKCRNRPGQRQRRVIPI